MTRVPPARIGRTALASYRQALPIGRKLIAGDATNADWQRDLAETQDKIGQTLEAQENVAEALPAYREALGIYEKLAGQSPDDKPLQGLVAAVSYHLGRALTLQQPLDKAQARGALERARDLFQRLQAAERGALSAEHAAMLNDTLARLNQLGR